MSRPYWQSSGNWVEMNWEAVGIAITRGEGNIVSFPIDVGVMVSSLGSSEDQVPSY